MTQLIDTLLMRILDHERVQRQQQQAEQAAAHQELMDYQVQEFGQQKDLFDRRLKSIQLEAQLAKFMGEAGPKVEGKQAKHAARVGELQGQAQEKELARTLEILMRKLAHKEEMLGSRYGYKGDLQRERLGHQTGQQERRLGHREKLQGLLLDHQIGQQERRLGHETSQQERRLGHQTSQQERRLGHEMDVTGLRLGEQAGQHEDMMDYRYDKLAQDEALRREKLARAGSGGKSAKQVWLDNSRKMQQGLGALKSQFLEQLAVKGRAELEQKAMDTISELAGLQALVEGGMLTPEEASRRAAQLPLAREAMEAYEAAAQDPGTTDPGSVPGAPQDPGAIMEGMYQKYGSGE